MIRSFSYKQFENKHELIQLKKKRNLSLSLVIPALNEAATIGKIIGSICFFYQKEIPLLDEIVVIDGLSSDGTVKVARDAGATVHSIDSAGPSVPWRGKGVSLWKSQFVTKGDIVAFMDADILNFMPHFISGLFGPFLSDESVSFVKAFYKRPLLIGDQYYESYGGRVTELLVRPMLSSFTPELARIYQPLAGEYAFRRATMESLPFSSGYGVEIGLLFDHYTLYDLSSFAQVDIGERQHRNRPLHELSNVSFGVMQTLMKKLEQQGFISFKKPISPVMVSRRGEKWNETILGEAELPPKKMVDHFGKVSISYGND